MRYALLSSVLSLAACATTVDSADTMADRYSMNNETLEKGPPPAPRRLEVTKADAAPSDGFILQDSYANPVGVYRLRAYGEPFSLSDFSFHNFGDDQTVQNVTVVYYDTTGTAVSSVGYLAANTVTFSGEDVFVPVNPAINAYLVVYSDADDGTDAVPGFNLRLDWVDTGVQMTGLRSGNHYGSGITTNAVEGVHFVYHIGEPTFDEASGSPRGDGIPGLNEVFRFNIMADAHGYLDFGRFDFSFASSDNNGTGSVGGDWNTCWGDGGDGLTNVDGDEIRGLTRSDFSLYNHDDLSEQLETDDSDWHLLNAAGEECQDDDQVVTVQLDLTEPENWVEIAAGTTETYSLKIDTSGASEDDDDSILVGIDDVGWGDSGWSTFDGVLVNGIPFEGSTIFY